MFAGATKFLLFHLMSMVFLAQIDLTDPMQFLMISGLVSFAAGTGAALKSETNLRQSLAQWITSGSFGWGVSMVAFHKQAAMGIDHIFLLGLAILVSAGGEKARELVYGFINKFLKTGK